MKVFLWSSGQQSGPFSLEDIHNMKRLGSLSAETHAAREGQEQWLPLEQFLVANPLPIQKTQSSKPKPERAGPSRLRALAGAVTVGIIGGLVLAIPGAIWGFLIPVLWFPIGWIAGFVAVEWGHTEDDQVVGLFAVGGTLIGIFISLAGLGMHQGVAVIILGGLGALGSFIGSIWLAFKSGSNR
jgi:hypothetical protein